MKDSMKNIQVIKAELFSQEVADRIIEIAEHYIKKNGAFYLSLSGGNTPKSIYQQLAVRGKERIDWQRVYMMFGDERYVGKNDPDSNYRMVSEALFSKIPIPEDNILPFDTSYELPSAAAQAYEEELLRKMPLDVHGVPIFDLILLGMGGDGHTASLFPDTDILMSKSLVDAVFVEKMNSMRLSVTFKMINSAKNAWVMIAGSGKEAVLTSVLNSSDSTNYPIERVKPKGQLIWLLDDKAAEGVVL